MDWQQKIAEEMGSKHSDTVAVVRAGKKGAKKRSNRRIRRDTFDTDIAYKEQVERADEILFREQHGLTDEWYEE